MNRRRFLTRGFALTAGGIFVPRILKAQLGDPSFVSSLTQPAAAEDGGTFVIDEDFEACSATAPTGWEKSSGTNNPTWNQDTTGLDMVGSCCVQIPINGGSSTTVRVALPADLDELYVTFRFRLTTGFTNSAFVLIRDSVPNTLAIFSNSSGDGTGTCQATGGSVSSGTVEKCSASSSQRVKLYYKKGTGANAIATVWLSTGSAWGTGKSSSNGTVTAACHWVYFTNSSGTTGFYFDKVRVSETDIAWEDA